MRTLSIREVREALRDLEQLVASEGEVTVTRHGRPIARILPIKPTRKMRSHAALRNSMPRLTTPSEVLVREDRDTR